MKQRIKVEFKVGKHTIFKSPRELTIEQLENMKHALALTCRCQTEDIEVIYTAPNSNISKLDISKNGLHIWDSMKVISGLSLPFELGSDAHLDAILDGTIDNKLKFV